MLSFRPRWRSIPIRVWSESVRRRAAWWMRYFPGSGWRLWHENRTTRCCGSFVPLLCPLCALLRDRKGVTIDLYGGHSRIRTYDFHRVKIPVTANLLIFGGPRRYPEAPKLLWNPYLFPDRSQNRANCSHGLSPLSSASLWPPIRFPISSGNWLGSIAFGGAKPETASLTNAHFIPHNVHGKIIGSEEG